MPTAEASRYRGPAGGGNGAILAGRVTRVADVLAAVPRRALAVFAHPDDPDVACGGTLKVWSDAGCQVHVCICADGDKGSLDPAVQPQELASRRRAEVEAAGRVLGVSDHHWLGFADGDLDSDGGRRILAALVHLIRAVRPQAVIGADPTAVFFGQHYVNHRDHRTVGWAVLDAVSPAAANPHYFPEAGPPYAVETLLLTGTLEADCWVDVSPTIEAKAAAVACHVSQVGEGGEWLRTVVRQRAEEEGRQANVSFAEAYRRIALSL
jgi:LmbE family N-acetylglucosaminyl deacetylase